MSDIAADRLRSFIKRIERLEEEKAEIAHDIKEVKAEAKSAGFDVKTINTILKRRKLSREELAEQEALLDVYEHAIGQLAGTPLGDAAVERVKADPAVRRAAKRFKDAVAQNPGDSVSIITPSGATTITNVDGQKFVTRTEAPPGTKTVAGAVDALKQQIAAG